MIEWQSVAVTIWLIVCMVGLAAGIGIIVTPWRND